MRKLILRCLTALAALAHAAVSPSRAADDLTSNDLASQLRGRCVHDGAMIAHYEIDGSYLVSGLLASRAKLSLARAHGPLTGDQRRLYFDDGDWRRDFLAVMPEGKIRFVSDGGNLRWRHASTEGRKRRLSHVLRRGLIVRHGSPFQAGRPHGAPKGIVTAFKPCRGFQRPASQRGQRLLSTRRRLQHVQCPTPSCLS